MSQETASYLGEALGPGSQERVLGKTGESASMAFCRSTYDPPQFPNLA